MRRKNEPHIFIGTSGWSYQHWKENFYPEGLKPIDWLHYYSSEFSTVEINTTFYHSPLQTTIDNWYAKVPKDFTFSIKASRYLTHIKRLKNCRESVDYFYRNIRNLKSKIGPILIQLPPSFKADKDRLIEFIGYLNNKYMHVFEFRHPSWFSPEIYKILSKNNIALCITDLNGKLSPEVITAHFTYIRLHGPQRAYTGSYGPSGLKKWQKRIEEWINSKTSVYCYFDNDDKGYAIKDAQKIKEMLNISG